MCRLREKYHTKFKKKIQEIIYFYKIGSGV